MPEKIYKVIATQDELHFSKDGQHTVVQREYLAGSSITRQGAELLAVELEKNSMCVIKMRIEEDDWFDNDMIYHVIAVKSVKKLAVITESKSVLACTVSKVKAEELCKKVATSGENINRAFVTMCKMNELEPFIDEENGGFLVYDSNGQRLDQDDDCDGEYN